MNIFEKIIPTLPEGQVISVNIGLFWTAVMVECKGVCRCGLAATLSNPEFEHARLPAVEEAGRIEQHSGLDLANWVFSKSYTEVSVGLATINALLPLIENPRNLAAEDYIAHQGADSQVALIGHFPFVSSLKDQVKKLWVLELNPKDDDLPASAAPEIIPQADILAITATTLINHTFDGILTLRKPGAKVLLLGPSTPLSPVLFEYGIDVLSGSIVENPELVLPLVRQGATFRQIRNNGVRLVTIEASS
ncbi:MAG TPA: DUF364 domain-containing protein [Anaerolineaceae bacterium]|nr:DUF364 domain-containing protein [Anaerolineaceae bacterium]HPN53983.1 DUF364 domain-containing protein [Anaerolineaceae bacterium]